MEQLHLNKNAQTFDCENGIFGILNEAFELTNLQCTLNETRFETAGGTSFEAENIRIQFEHKIFAIENIGEKEGKFSNSYRCIGMTPSVSVPTVKDVILIHCTIQLSKEKGEKTHENSIHFGYSIPVYIIQSIKSAF